jgi:hypothetical protein
MLEDGNATSAGMVLMEQRGGSFVAGAKWMCVLSAPERAKDQGQSSLA